MAPRPKVSEGLSMANKGKGWKTIIILEILVDMNLLDLGSWTLDNRNRDNITPDDT
jgi:hypothetical protein